jgi:hypothetical protein
MKRHSSTLLSAVLLVLLLAVGSMGANSGSGTVKLGYTFIDNDGSLALQQETYNFYEGFGLSLNNWMYSLKNGATIAADLNNITLNNRVMLASINKPGQYTLSVNNSQYRRVYDSAGDNFTRRASTGVEAKYQFGRNVKFNGGYGLTSKHGKDFEILSPINDTVVTTTDYTQTTYHFGTELSCPHGTLRVDYRRLNFDDKTDFNGDRTADNVNVLASTAVPKLSWLYLTAGYGYRLDKIKSDSTKLRTNQPWGSVKAYLPYGFYADYRLVYGMTRHTNPLQETDNILHVMTVGKNWPRYGGVRLGGEYAISDNFMSQTSSKGFLANAWVRPSSEFFFSGSLSTRKKSVPEGTILTGEEDATRYSLLGKYQKADWGSFSIKWENRVRKNPDIISRVDFSGLTPMLTLERKSLGSLTVMYSYYLGKFDDLSNDVSYEFQDHVLTGTVRSREIVGLVAEAGATYYRSKRDQDLEKSNLEFGLSYRFLKNHHIEVRYNIFNYDDFLSKGYGYTGNIVEVNLLKDITF